MQISRRISSITILGIFIIILMFTNIHVLILEDLTDRRVILLEKINPTDEFKMRWIHSVELQPWEEIFSVDSDYNIILDSTRFKSFGAGVPDFAGKKTEIKDGYIIFSGIDRQMKDLQYRASNLAKHTFHFKDEELKLYEIVGDENVVKIRISYINLIKYFELKIVKAASI